MENLTAEQIQTIKLARQKTIENAWQLLQNAVQLFEGKQYALACFLAMTTIEEIGKLFVLQFAQGDLLKIVNQSTIKPPKLDLRKLGRFLRSHLEKAIQAAAVSLYINAGADRRHGIHPISGMHRTSGVILLARSGRWMDIRNACLYTDLDLTASLASSPDDVIRREHAYYFICMAFEVLAEQSSSGFGNSFESSEPEITGFWQGLASDLAELIEGASSHADFRELLEEAIQNYPLVGDNNPINKSMQFWEDRLNDLSSFMKRWANTVDIDKLEFLANPEPLREEAKRCEGVQQKIASPSAKRPGLRKSTGKAKQKPDK
jgi:AbiV family abortive infection protein